MTLRVVTDSTADLPQDEAAALGVTVVPLTILFGSESLRDQVDIGPEEFFRRLVSSSVLPKTSQPSPAAFADAYSRLLNEGATEILSIHISGKLSGTVNSARTARDSLPNPTAVTILDSGTVTAEMAYGIRAAARVAAAGGNAEQARAAAERALRHSHLYAVLDTLEYLQKGGRIGRARAWIGGLLNVKPMITVKDGEVAPLERVRGRSRAIDRLVELTAARTNAAEITILHSGSPEELERVRARIQAACPGALIRAGWLGPVVGVYGGPNLIGAVVLDQEGVSP
jgi:DegV family protein with EDD domain